MPAPRQVRPPRTCHFPKPDPGGCQAAPGRENLFYFSYTTLTTLGYGDIVPANRITEMLASMESIVGQVFLAVFMARLLGAHISQEGSVQGGPE